jgi:hypothetical protein
MPQPTPILSRSRWRLPRLLALPALALAAVLLGGCGGSTPSSAAEAEQSKEQQAEAKFADFARCLREHGIDAETASGPNGGHGLKISPGKAGPNPENMEAAQKACKRYAPEPQKLDLSPQQKVEREEAVQKFAKCMREHGIKVEASTQGGAIRIGIQAHPGEAGAPNPESPAFQEAQTTCQKLLPGGGPGSGKPAKLRPGQSQSSEGGVVAGG